MINQDILYLKKANRATMIKYKNQDVIIVDKILENLLDDYFAKDLSTLKGRLLATSKVYHIYKHIPLYLGNNITLIQAFNKKEIDNIYINSYNIIDMVKDETKTKILFLDGSSITINKPYRIFKKYYDLSLEIKKIQA